ncbi:MAG TPA: hypothetical protein VNG29_02845 [Candidatus Paceibacterota bacterium]|nr:hypothetical protein [Candidatus Paceibacterota bacterium]
MFKKLSSIGGALFFLGYAGIAFAQSSSGCTGGGLVNPLGVCNIPSFVAQLLSALLVIAAPIATIMALYGGFQMMTAGGNPEKFSKGRKTLLYTAIGFVVILLAQQVVPIINVIFL